MRESKKSGNGEDEQHWAWEEETARLQRRTHDFIRQRPLLALTMAVVSGYVAGRALSRV
jgi:hypothetical protein